MSACPEHAFRSPERLAEATSKNTISAGALTLSQKALAFGVFGNRFPANDMQITTGFHPRLALYLETE